MTIEPILRIFNWNTKEAQSLIKKFRIVELEADVNVRIERNKTPFRLEEKPTKRNVEWSQNELINGMKQYRLNLLPGGVKHKNYLKINNSDLDPDTVADLIIEYFKLQNVVE